MTQQMTTYCQNHLDIQLFAFFLLLYMGLEACGAGNSRKEVPR